MNLHDNRVSIIDYNEEIKTYSFFINNILKLAEKYIELSNLTIEKIPSSMKKSKLIVLYPDYIDDNEETEILMAEYSKIERKYFTTIKFMSDKISILRVFRKLFIGIYLIKCNDMVFGFGANGGWPLTEMIYFDFNDSVEYMISQISNAMSGLRQT